MRRSSSRVVRPSTWTELNDDQLSQIKSEVTKQGAKLSASLVLHPGVLADLLTIVGN